MVINKKNAFKAANDISNDQKKKIEKEYKSKIQEEVSGIDDRRSSKFITGHPCDEHTSVQLSDQMEDIDVEQARTAVLEEIKNQELKENDQVKKEKKPKIKTPELNFNKPKIQKIPIAKHFIKKLFIKKPVKKKEALEINLESRLKVIINAFLFLLIFCFILISLGLYFGRWQSPLTIAITKTVPYPAAYVNGHAIRAHTFLSDSAVLAEYLMRQGQEVSNHDVRQQVLDRLIEMEVIKQLAAKKGLSISDLEVQQQLDLIFGGQEEIDSLTKELYGWDLDTYVKKIVKPIFIAKKVEDDFYQSKEGGQIKEKMQGVYNLILEDETRFEQIASEVNQDESQVLSGDLGWLKLGETAPEFEFQLLKLEPGQISPLVETSYGYHIIRLEEKMVDNNDQPVFHASHIYMKRPSFTDYISGQIEKATIVTLMRI